MSDKNPELHDLVEMTRTEVVASTMLAQHLSSAFVNTLADIPESAARKSVVGSAAIALFIAECLYIDGERGERIKERMALIAEAVESEMPRVIGAHALMEKFKGGGHA